MRLINVETDELEEFFGDDIPEYAILSHTWESPGEEVSFDDFVEGKTATREYGAQKLKGFCNQARDDGYTYAWIDTCCIDKRNAVELGEAINSMFQWYKGAAICYVYLSDVLPGDDFRRPESNFISSRWFRRGWTLQELLAPDELSFFDRGWTCIGTKGDMSTEIEAITGIPRQFLLGWENFRTASVAQRMSWAANRKTTRKEDIAYCLLGIFDVTMAMIYGEGDRALIRLQQEIIKHTGDHSVLAWGLDAAESIAETPAQSAGILATTAAEFANCGSIVVKKQDTRPANTFDISSGRLRVQLCLQTFPSGETYGLLDCGPQGTEQVVAIPLHKVVSDVASNEYLRPQGRHPIYFPQPISNSVPKDIQILMERHESSHTKSRRYWFYVDGHKDMDLELSDIHPTVRWEKQRAMIAEVTDSNKTVIHRFLARFRALSSQSQDFIAMLEFQLQGLQAKARCHVMTFPRRTTLDFLSQTLTNMKPEEFERRSATNGVVCVKMTVKEEHLATFVVRLATMPTAEHLEEVALTHSRAHAQTVALAQMGLYVPQAREVKATHALKAAVRGNRSRKAALALLQQYSKTAEGEIIDLQGNQELDKQFKDMTKCNHGYQWTRQRAGWRCLGGAHFLTNEQFDTLNDRLDLKTAANDDELQMEDAVDDGSDSDSTRPSTEPGEDEEECEECRAEMDLASTVNQPDVLLRAQLDSSLDVTSNPEIAEKLRELSGCNMGFKWNKAHGGWRCENGAHCITDEQFEILDRRFNLRTACRNIEFLPKDATENGSESSPTSTESSTESSTEPLDEEQRRARWIVYVDALLRLKSGGLQRTPKNLELAEGLREMARHGWSAGWIKAPGGWQYRDGPYFLSDKHFEILDKRLNLTAAASRTTNRNGEIQTQGAAKIRSGSNSTSTKSIEALINHLNSKVANLNTTVRTEEIQSPPDTTDYDSDRIISSMKSLGEPRDNHNIWITKAQALEDAVLDAKPGTVFNVSSNPDLARHLREMTRCGQGSKWTKFADGWRCEGGGHSLSDADLGGLLAQYVHLSTVTHTTPWPRELTEQLRYMAN